MDLLKIANIPEFISTFSFILLLAITFFFDDGNVKSIMKIVLTTVFVISFVVFGTNCVFNYL